MWDTSTWTSPLVWGKRSKVFGQIVYKTECHRFEIRKFRNTRMSKQGDEVVYAYYYLYCRENGIIWCEKYYRVQDCKEAADYMLSPEGELAGHDVDVRPLGEFDSWSIKDRMESWL